MSQSLLCCCRIPQLSFVTPFIILTNNIWAAFLRCIFDYVYPTGRPVPCRKIEYIFVLLRQKVLFYFDLNKAKKKSIFISLTLTLVDDWQFGHGSRSINAHCVCLVQWNLHAVQWSVHLYTREFILKSMGYTCSMIGPQLNLDLNWMAFLYPVNRQNKRKSKDLQFL